MPPRAEEFQPGNEFDTSPKTGFTLSLLETIEASKAKMDRWVDIQKAKIDEEAAVYNRKLKEEQQEIDDLVEKIMRAQSERGLRMDPDEDENQTVNIMNKKALLELQKQEIESKINKLKSECKNRKKRVEEISLEEEKQRFRAEDARALKKRVQEAKQTTVDDLTRGILHYKHLGLDFEKTEGENEIRFTYSQLDPEVPTRLFSFVLQVDKNDKYEIYDCKPSVDATILLDVTDRLNRADDYMYLARRMRQAFAETLDPLQNVYSC
eukprot:CAMPEP_0113635930 /NCGR_PEP_ID=MMETSP0017_2-20120614/18740_1 /TAXON_ID=2856 /ORGANISM="Cylindrotheca closterium" /LENGTH=265 /DNA_ID=CAMNT_0000546753 /DNA_START=45 /DNA_END=842 /DNA_ORIENTATION=+ /assembly_acc=CAM_ASM_000147